MTKDTPASDPPSDAQTDAQIGLTKDAIQKLVAEEVLRPEVQRALTSKRESYLRQLGTLLRHPIFLTLLGFVLTSIVGTLIGQTVADRTQRDAELAEAFEAVQSFASEASELRVRQDFLISALDRGVSRRAMLQAKSDYDESFLSWNTTRYQNFLSIRSFFGFTYDNFAEQAISRTIHQDFKAFNACLEDIFDAFESLPGSAEVAGATPLRDQLNRCLNATGREGRDTESDGRIDAVEYRSDKIFQCSRRIFDSLHHFIAKDINCSSSTWRPRADGKVAIVEVLYDGFWKECGVGDRKPYNRHAASFETFCTIEKPSGLLSWLP